MKTSAFSLTRRTALFAAAAAGFVAAAPLAARQHEQAFASSPWRKLSDADWKSRLPPEAYQVLRHEGTEQPFTSPLLNEHRKGVFACLGCGLPLFKSDWKFDSHTGWPSFWTEMPGALGKQARLRDRHSAHGVPLRPLPGPPGPRLRRRPAPHRPALLQQRRRPEVHPGLVRRVLAGVRGRFGPPRSPRPPRANRQRRRAREERGGRCPEGAQGSRPRFA